MIQGASAPRLLFARVFSVLLLLVAGTYGIAIGAGVAGGSSFAAVGLWLACAGAYALFWGGAAMWIAIRFRRRTDVALGALGTWIALVLFLPAAVQFGAETLYPVPSRVEYLMKARDAEAQARREIDERAEVYMAEHEVELGDGADKIPDFYRKYFIANEHIRDQTSPLVQVGEEQREAQSRIANQLEFAAPPMLAARLLAQVCGTGSERAAQYRKQVRSHLGRLHQSIGPATVAKRRISLAQARAIPDFEFQEPTPSLPPFLGIGWLLIVGGGLSLAARRRARVLSPVFGD